MMKLLEFFYCIKTETASYDKIVLEFRISAGTEYLGDVLGDVASPEIFMSVFTETRMLKFNNL